MRLRWLWVPLFIFGFCSTPASADTRVIVRTTLGLHGLQAFCNGLPLLQSCTVVGGLDGPLNQLFLITTPLDLTTILNLLGNTVGIVDAEADQLLNLVGGLNQVTTPPASLSDTTPVSYSGSTVWNGYANQPAAQIVRVSQAKTTFQVTGTGIVADIDTGVDPNHPVFKPVLMPGFDVKSNSLEFSKALDYANQNNVICASSAGNDGMQEIVYPAAFQNDVMGVASTSDTDTRSSFSNYGDAIVWVAAPGEAIVTTYPFSSYAAGWGTSFSAPFVSGAGALLLNLDKATNQSKAAAAVAHAVPVGSGMGNGRLDLVQALQSVAPPVGNPADFAISINPSGSAVNPGQAATFTISATPSGGFNHVVMFTCSGLPTGASCTVAPSSVTLDGTNASTAKLVVTTSHGGALLWTRLHIEPRINPWSATALLAAWILFLVILIASRGVQRRTPRVLLAGSAILLAALCSSCGSGVVTTTNPGKGPPGPTPSGKYDIVVTGSSGNVSHATTTQLTVN